MAQIIKNDKGFKVIKLKTSEMFDIWKGTLGICDFCNKASTTDEGLGGYYVAVLNRVYCQEDYERWILTAVNYPEDAKIESRNFEHVKNLLGL